MKRLPALCAALLLTGCMSGLNAHDSTTTPATAASAAGFVAKEQQNAAALAQDVTALITEAARADPLDTAGMTQLAGDAQTLHGHLTDFRAALLSDADAASTDQLDLITAENDVKSAVGAVNTWCGNPNPSTAASWQRQMATGVAEWNAATTKLWVGQAAPTITIPT